MNIPFLQPLAAFYNKYKISIRVIIGILFVILMLWLAGCSEGDTSTGDGSGVNITITNTPSRSDPIDSVITILLPSGEAFCNLPTGETLSAERILKDSSDCQSCQSLLAGSCPNSFTP